MKATTHHEAARQAWEELAKLESARQRVIDAAKAFTIAFDHSQRVGFTDEAVEAGGKCGLSLCEAVDALNALEEE